MELARSLAPAVMGQDAQLTQSHLKELRGRRAEAVTEKAPLVVDGVRVPGSCEDSAIWAVSPK